jgi:hypothetical protein
MKETVPQRPELKGYEKFVLGYTLFYSLPWMVMGVGIVVGATHNTFDYLSPCTNNVYVWAFHLTVVLLIIGLASWGWFFGGAAYLIKYINVRSELTLKLRLGLSVLALFFVFWIGCVMQRQAEHDKSIDPGANSTSTIRR